MLKETDAYIADNPEYNLIPKDKVALIKMKLGKSHRKESDWAVIKDILCTYNLIVCEPKGPSRWLRTVEHILVEDGALIAFTNLDDCVEHIRRLNEKSGKPNRSFTVGVMPFEQAVAICEEYGMDLYIDIQVKVNTVFMAYVHGEEQIKAVMVARNTES